MRHLVRTFVVPVFVVLVAGACNRDHGPTTGTEKAADTPAPGASAGPGLTDAEVMGVLVTANQGEVEFSQAGLAQLTNPAVKTFAENMIKHHGEGLAKARQAANEAKLEVAKSDVTAKLESDVKSETGKLQAGGSAAVAAAAPAGGGSEKDIAFMCAQVRLHKGVLDTVDSKLAPAAKDDKVKEQVSTTRPVVNAHLEEAKSIVQKLSGKSADAACG